ncbi:unnamed protein product [Phaeothamnion confervicola]
MDGGPGSAAAEMPSSTPALPPQQANLLDFPFPMFAPAERTNGDGDLLGSLDDVFTDVVWSPDGDLLKVPLAAGGGGLTLSVSPPPLPPLLDQLGGATASAASAASTARGVAGLGISMPRHAPFGAVRAGRIASAGDDDDDDGDDSDRGGKGSPGASKRRQRPNALTEEQKLERRERNREHAKRSRVRKKFLLDSLQRSVNALQEENELLKDSIREHLGPVEGEQLVAQCTPAPDSLVASAPGQATKILDDPDYSLVKALQTAQQNFVITDASLPDNPIVYASGGFVELTGYALDQILGRNCRFLQGPATDPRAVDRIRAAVEKGEDTSVCLLNYRSDGTTFWNQFFVASLRDSDGNTVNFVGVQCKVSEEYAKIVVEQQEKDLENLRRQRERERQRAAKQGTAGGASGSGMGFGGTSYRTDAT